MATAEVLKPTYLRLKPEDEGFSINALLKFCVFLSFPMQATKGSAGEVMLVETLSTREGEMLCLNSLAEVYFIYENYAIPRA